MIQADVEELLAVARSALLEQVLPHVNGDASYQVRMIANAMGIAAREMGEADACASEEQAVLRDLLGKETTAADLLQHKQLLCKLITAGCFDSDPERQRLIQGLHRITVARLRISNPKLVKDEND